MMHNCYTCLLIHGLLPAILGVYSSKLFIFTVCFVLTSIICFCGPIKYISYIIAHCFLDEDSCLKTQTTAVLSNIKLVILVCLNSKLVCNMK